MEGVLAVVEWSPEQLRAALNAPNPPVVLDVRHRSELALVSFPGAVHVPLAGFEQAVEDGLDGVGPADVLSPDRPVVLLCHHGIRSRMAAHCLAQMGFSQPINLQGGIDAWALRVDPSMGRY